MNIIKYAEQGITVNCEFIPLQDIVNNCNFVKIKNNNLALLVIEWEGWRGFEEGIKEEIVLPIENINIIKKHIVGKEINFGEIAGKHSEIVNFIDDNDIIIIEDHIIIQKFLLDNPDGRKYRHSFLEVFYNNILDRVYDDIPEDDLGIFNPVSKLI